MNKKKISLFCQVINKKNNFSSFFFIINDFSNILQQLFSYYITFFINKSLEIQIYPKIKAD